MQAIWNNIVIAESEETVKLEGQIYFPYDSVKLQYLVKNGRIFSSATAGVCDYYNIEVGGVVAKDGASMCPNPKQAAESIRDYFIFSKDITLKKN